MKFVTPGICAVPVLVGCTLWAFRPLVPNWLGSAPIATPAPAWLRFPIAHLPAFAISWGSSSAPAATLRRSPPFCGVEDVWVGATAPEDCEATESNAPKDKGGLDACGAACV